MKQIPVVDVDLTRPPSERWRPLLPFVEPAKQLLAMYLTDLGGLTQFEPIIPLYREACVEPEYAAELAAIAAMADLSENEVLVGNLYYDAIKLVLGCTAFAVDTPNGPLHARNLDWWTENGLLSQHTLITNFRNGATEPLFQSVGWPGYIGTLSGLAPGRFAITMNAVLSTDPPALAQPIPFVLRTVCEKASSFTEAVDMLTTAELASDCLLLVTGTRRQEMVVIERTPTRAATRYPQSGYIVVANDYQALDAIDAHDTGQELQATSCGRYERAHALLSEELPQDAAACFKVLNDAWIKMRITVQQMVMSAALGSLDVGLPDTRLS